MTSPRPPDGEETSIEIGGETLTTATRLVAAPNGAANEKSPKAGRKLWRAGTLIYTTGGVVGLFCWLLGGDFGFQFKERAIPPALQLLLRRFHASDLLVGLLLVSLPQMIALVASPVLGYLSDRHRGPRGRRIPFLLISTPFAVVAMAGLSCGPAIGRWLHHLFARPAWSEDQTVLAVLAMFWAGFEFCTTIGNGLFVALITDVVPPQIVGRFFALFRVVTLGAGMTFSYFLFGQVERHYMPVFLAVAAVYAVSFGAMCLKVKEGKYPPPVAGPVGLRRMSAFGAAARSYLTDGLSNPYYRWIYLASALGFMAILPFNLYVVYYAQSLNVSMSTLGNYITVMLSLSLVQAYPIGWLVDRFHPLRLTIVALLCFVIVNLGAFIGVRTPAAFGPAVVTCGIMAGFWAITSAPLGTMLFPKEKFGLFYSVQLVAAAVGQIVVAPACGWTLDHLHHDYRYLFLWAAGLGACACAATIVVYRQFLTYGGPIRYVPPP